MPTSLEVLVVDVPRCQQAIQSAETMLSKARTLQDYVKVRKLATNAHKAAKKLGLGFDAQNAAMEVKIKAGYYAGRFLSQRELRGGDRKSRTAADRKSVLAMAGISHNDSSIWQKLACIPEDTLVGVLNSARASNRRVVEADFVRLANIMRQMSEEPRDLSAPPPLTMEAYKRLTTEVQRNYELLQALLETLLPADARHIELLMGEIAEDLRLLNNLSRERSRHSPSR